MGFSDYAEDKVLDHSLAVAAWTIPTNVYVSLHTGDPGDTGANEVTGGSYARLLATFGAASGGTSSTTATLDFTDMPAVTVSHIGIWDASTAGNLIYHAGLSSAKSVSAGDTFRIASGDLDVTLD